MKISTRGRYALRVMIDLAEHSAEGYIPLQSVAERQGISNKYIENIMVELSKAKIVDAKHGKGGGYKLAKSPEDYTVAEILKITEGDLSPVECLSPDAPPCDKVANCKTIGMWKDFNRLIEDFFSKITIKDLSSSPQVYDYII